jgi:hypothetical protein
MYYHIVGRGGDRMVVGFIATYMPSVPVATIYNAESWNPVQAIVLDTTLCDEICQCLVTDLWFSPGTSVSSTNKTDCHNMTEILLKVALSTIYNTNLYLLFFSHFLPCVVGLWCYIIIYIYVNNKTAI